MILKKQSNPSARWDSTANTWWIGETHEYQWTDEKTKEYSPWMNLDDALVWIKNRDQEKNLESKKVGSWKNFLEKELLNLCFDLSATFFHTALRRCSHTTLLPLSASKLFSNLPQSLLQNNTHPATHQKTIILPAIRKNTAWPFPWFLYTYKIGSAHRLVFLSIILLLGLYGY